MTLEEENEHLRRANMALQRRLERARRDALLYAAMVCEEHVIMYNTDERTMFLSQKKADQENHRGEMYAAKLREIAR